LSSLPGGTFRRDPRSAAMRAAPNPFINLYATVFRRRKPVMPNVKMDIEDG
jgi:hypothetical protein